MAKPLRQPSKQYVQIETVGRKTRKLEGRLKDRGVVAIGIYEISQAFRWPKVGEFWSVVNENGTWMLGHRLELDPDAKFPVEDLEEGELRLDSDAIKDASGKTVVATEPAVDEQVPSWDDTNKEWKPTNIAQLTGADAHFTWTQNASATDWGDPLPSDPTGPKYIAHNLGKRPAVSVTDFGGNQVEVHVHYVDNNKLQISTAVPTSGIVYFN